VLLLRRARGTALEKKDSQWKGAKKGQRDKYPRLQNSLRALERTVFEMFTKLGTGWWGVARTRKNEKEDTLRVQAQFTEPRLATTTYRGSING